MNEQTPAATILSPETDAHHSFDDAKAAVAALQKLYETACDFLTERFSQMANAPAAPNCHYRAFYPEIRLRTTVVRTFQNTLVTLPNSMLTNSSIDNFSRMASRRMDCNFGVVYSTTADQIEGIVNDVKTYLQSHPEQYDSTYWVGFEGFGDSTLDISVIAYTVATDKTTHMRHKQAFMLAIMRIVRAHGSDFAFPTRVLQIEKASPESKPAILEAEAS